MAQIQAINVYIPYYRLKYENVGKAWHQGAGPGERSVANLDEDSLTMGVAAAHGLLDQTQAGSLDALYFATTTPPYTIKQSAAQIACVLGLPESAVTMDFGGSFRAGTGALMAAADAVNSGRAHKVLVVVSDSRIAMPASPDEIVYGDAACAILIGPGDGGLFVKAMESRNSALLDRWQRAEDKYAVSWEDRFVNLEGYQRDVVRTVSALMAHAEIKTRDVTKFIFSAHDFRNPVAAAKTLGADPKQQLADTLLTRIGYAGAAGVLIALYGAVTSASPGDRFIMASHGDGCDALLLEIGDKIGSVCQGLSLAEQLAAKSEISYVDYLRFRNVLANQVTDQPEGTSSAPLIWREKKAVWRLVAHRCRKCNTVHYPMERICYKCRSKDDFDEVPLSHESGALFTYTKDFLFQGGDPPQVMAVVESKDGCRLYLQMTDRDPEAVYLGMPLVFTFRKIHEGAGFHNYFWKCRPARTENPKGK